jgi:hypothetical protein
MSAPAPACHFVPGRGVPEVPGMALLRGRRLGNPPLLASHRFSCLKSCRRGRLAALQACLSEPSKE